MKKILLIISFIFLISFPGVFSQTTNDTIVCLITCGPGTETYSIYGHSAIRIIIPEKKSDIVYNWGIFDFGAPNFAWKFAKGRLNYSLGVESFRSFLRTYVYEQRFVYSQKINLNPDETKRLVDLINENYKPENRNYRYDFFYDDCSTRIRDLLEKAIGGKLLYPPSETGKLPTFRQMVGKYQNLYPWLNFGIDLIMGSPGEKKASFRDRMFLPIDMKAELSETVINRSGKMIPLLQNPEVILSYDPPVKKQNFLTTPVFAFTLLLILIIILSSLVKSRKLNNAVDIVIFSVFSVLAVLMIFFNFFTDHQQMKWNLNILWLNPLILMCLLSLILKKAGTIWYRILFYISGSFLVLHFILPQNFNIAFLPLVLIILVRSSIRAEFEWNPLSKNRI
jgi:heme/copper-type cytochrome/quinol oxidase subunit 4